MLVLGLASLCGMGAGAAEPTLDYGAQIKALTERVERLERLLEARESAAAAQTKKQIIATPAKSKPPATKPPPVITAAPLGEISNPNPQHHRAFTALLKSPHLHWADSLRPTGSKAEIERYYGRRQNGGSGKSADNPRVSYDAKHEAMRVEMKKGEKGIPHAFQTRIKFPSLAPENADSATVIWEYKIPPSGWAGGKQFQIATRRSNLHTEFTLWGRNEVHGTIPGDNWIRLPALRVYGTRHIGGRGLSDLLVGGSSARDDPGYCAGIFRCTLQPNLPESGSVKSKRSVADHKAGRLFAMRPNVWATVEITFDWRDKENHKLWMFLDDPETERTLVVGLNNDGYPLSYTPDKSPVEEWWVEFNNSKSVNSHDTYVWVRNLVVLRDAPIVVPKKP